MEVQDNIEKKEKLNKRKYGYFFSGVYFALVFILKFTINNFSDSGFYGLLSFGVIGIIVLTLFTRSKEDDYNRLLSKPMEIKENIAPEIITMSEVPDIMNEILTNKGIRVHNRGSEILGTYGDVVKRRVAIIPFLSLYDGVEMTFFISLSEPQNYSLIKNRVTGKNMHFWGENLAYAKAKENNEIVRELKTYIDPETGKEKQVRTLTENLSDSSNSNAQGIFVK